MPLRAWWYLRIAKGKTPPPAVRRYLMKRGMEQLKGLDLPPEMQKSLALEQLTAVLDDRDHVFDDMLGDVLQDALERLAKSGISPERDTFKQRQQQIINEGAAAGKTIPTDNVQKHVQNLKATYDGPDREEYVREIDRFVEEFREKHGSQIPVDEAYRMFKEIEEKHGKVD